MDIIEFIDIYGDYMYNYAHSITNNYHLAEDLIQDCYVKVINGIKLLSCLNQYQVRSWLSRTIKNLFIDEIRKTKHQNIIRKIPTFYEENMEMEVMVERMLTCLDEKELKVIKNKFWLGMTSIESAKELDITDSAVRHKIHKALEKLRKKI